MTAEAASDLGRLLRRARPGDATARGELLELYRRYLALLARLQIGRRLRGKIDAFGEHVDENTRAFSNHPPIWAPVLYLVAGRLTRIAIRWLRSNPTSTCCRFHRLRKTSPVAVSNTTAQIN